VSIPGVGNETLIFGKMNPPLPSTDVGQPQSPEDIKGCTELHPTSVLSAQFPLPLSLDVHVVVMHMREYLLSPPYLPTILSFSFRKAPQTLDSRGAGRVRTGDYGDNGSIFNNRLRVGLSERNSNVHGTKRLKLYDVNCCSQESRTTAYPQKVGGSLGG
jgi:hypothetical protein